MSKTEIVIAAPVRTAIGNYNGTLKGFPATDLGALVVGETLRRSGLHAGEIDSVVLHEYGRTFGDVLMEMRLSEACRMIRQARALKRPVSMGEISYHCGFVSQAHFSSRFRQQFGVSPRHFI